MDRDRRRFEILNGWLSIMPPNAQDRPRPEAVG